MQTTKGIAIPDTLARALRADDTAWETFQGMRPSCQRQYGRWVGSAKTQNIRERRIEATKRKIHSYAQRRAKAAAA